jgi:histidine ammonia-lyase
VHAIGSVGQADLAPLAEIAVALLDGIELEPGEGTALLDNNAFSTAWAALAIADTAALLDALDVAGAVSLEGFAANPTLLHPAIGRVRPYPGVRATIARFAELLDGSAIHEPGVPRNLQDPLSFRNLPQMHGAVRDALAHVDAVLAIELNASQGNPIVVPEEDRVVSVANFEIVPLAAVLDYLRIVLASALGVASERVVKSLYTPWSGLPTGLVPDGGTAHAGLTYLSLAAQSLAVEARLLAAPVSFELASTAHAEGIEDRTTMAPLAARRLAEMVEIGASIAAIELAVGAQGIELRGAPARPVPDHGRPGAGRQRPGGRRSERRDRGRGARDSAARARPARARRARVRGERRWRPLVTARPRRRTRTPPSRGACASS